MARWKQACLIYAQESEWGQLEPRKKAGAREMKASVKPIFPPAKGAPFFFSEAESPLPSLSPSLFCFSVLPPQVTVFEQEHYLANFVQATFDALKGSLKGKKEEEELWRERGTRRRERV